MTTTIPAGQTRPGDLIKTTPTADQEPTTLRVTDGNWDYDQPNPTEADEPTHVLLYGEEPDEELRLPVGQTVQLLERKEA